MVRLMIRKRSWGAWEDLGLMTELEAYRRSEEWKLEGYQVLTLDVAA